MDLNAWPPLPDIRKTSICSLTFITGPANVSKEKKAPWQLGYKRQSQLRDSGWDIYQPAELCFKWQRRNEHPENRQPCSHCRQRREKRRNGNIAEGDCYEIASSHALQYFSACICFLVGTELWCFPFSLHIQQLHSFQNMSFFLQLLLASWKVLTQKINHGFKRHRVSQSGFSRVSNRDENINLITETTLTQICSQQDSNLLYFSHHSFISFSLYCLGFVFSPGSHHTQKITHIFISQ